MIFLYCHAIELYLKAYLRAAGNSVADLRKIGHRVTRLAEAAASAGLKLDPEKLAILLHVDDEDVAIEARYIVTGFGRYLEHDALAGVAAQLDERVSPFLKNKGHHVRDQRFDPPRPQPSCNLGEDTTRVLVHLFRADDDESARSVEWMGQILGMQRSVLKYHLDQLDGLRLAHCTGADSEYVYWALRPEGRRYVVERRLDQSASLERRA